MDENLENQINLSRLVYNMYTKFTVEKLSCFFHASNFNMHLKLKVYLHLRQMNEGRIKTLGSLSCCRENQCWFPTHLLTYEELADFNFHAMMKFKFKKYASYWQRLSF